MQRRNVGFTTLLALAVGCGDSTPKGPAWRRASRDPGESARVEKAIQKLDASVAKTVTQTLDAMAATPRTADGLRAAAQLAVGATESVVPEDWAGSGTHPAVGVLHDASMGVLAGHVAATAKDAVKRGDPAKADVIAAVREIPLVTIYNSGGPISDERDRDRLLAELELVFGELPPRPSAPAPAAPSGACSPVEPQQRAAKAKVQLTGDVTQAMVELPAICGALHTEATKRFAVGDGTLFRACFPDGATLSISADVLLVGKVKPVFVYADYKKTGPLVELSRPGVGTYNQRDEPTDADKLDIAFDWSQVTLDIDLPWPSKKDRVVHVTATWDCGGPMRENTWGP